MLDFLQPARCALFLKFSQDNCCGHRTFFLTVTVTVTFAIVVASDIGTGQPDAD